MTDGAAVVLAPVVATLLTTVFVLWLMRGSSGSVPLDEIGTWYIATVAAYLTLPLLVYFALGMQYTPLNDARLFFHQPTPRTVANVAWLYAVYIASFALTYLIARGRRVGESRATLHFTRSTVVTAGLFWLVATAFVTSIGVLYDLRADSYSESYRVIQQLPLLVRQFGKLFSGVRFFLTLVLLIWLFSDFRRWRWIVLGWILFEMVQRVVVVGGQRTELMLLIAASLILYHRMVRPVPVRYAMIAGFSGLVLFMGLGYLRALEGLSGGNLSMNAGEFENLFANAVDLWQRSTENDLRNVPPAFAVADLVAVIPSQALPFPKIDISDWYLVTYYPEVLDRGGGFAFGAVAQAIVGAGAFEVFVRGSLVGFLFGRVHAWATRHTDRLWPTAIYLWTILWAYQTFRASTFHILPMFVQQVLPAILMVEVGRFVLQRIGTAPRDNAVVLPAQ